MAHWFLVLGIVYLIYGSAFRKGKIRPRRPSWIQHTPNSMMVPFWKASRFGQAGEVTDPRLWPRVTRRAALLCLAFGVIFLVAALIVWIAEIDEPRGERRFLLFAVFLYMSEGVVGWYADRTAKELFQQIAQDER